LFREGKYLLKFLAKSRTRLLTSINSSSFRKSRLHIEKSLPSGSAAGSTCSKVLSPIKITAPPRSEGLYSDKSELKSVILER